MNQLEYGKVELESCAKKAAEKNNRPSHKMVSAIRKDFHLVKTAIQTDKRIASLDETIRNHLRACSDYMPDLKKIAWVNPIKQEENASEWIRMKAPLEKKRLLGHTLNRNTNFSHE